MGAASVLLVAQSPVLCYGIRTVLETVLPLDDVTEATGALEAAGYAGSRCFDLIVIHDALPAVTGDVTTTMLRRLRPVATIVVMSDDDCAAHRDRVIANGANALFSMAIEPDSFSHSIGALSQPRPDDRVRIGGGFDDLSIQQIAVLDGIARGFEPWVIAERLRVDRESVELTTDALMAQLEVLDRVSITNAAIRLGLVDLQDQLPVLPYHHDFGIESAA
jgi:DNA-binding NarL/FixJ family response regulator